MGSAIFVPCVALKLLKTEIYNLGGLVIIIFSFPHKVKDF
jgi:hypothetical protein